jgi:hypothetical protein
MKLVYFFLFEKVQFRDVLPLLQKSLMLRYGYQ